MDQGAASFAGLIVTSTMLSIVLLAIAGIYALLRFKSREALRISVPSWRVVAFFGGLIFLWIAVASPVALLDHASLTMHMIQHLLLSTVSGPLLLLGEPFLVFSYRSDRAYTLSLATPNESRPRLSTRIVRFLTHPVLCWTASVATLIVWHVPALFALAMHSRFWHGAEQLTFFVTGLFFWWPVIEPWPATRNGPRWAIPIYLLAATFPCDALSAFLAFCDRVVYPSYLAHPPLFFASALQDQECAGALMWVCVTFIYLIPAVIVTINELKGSRANTKRTSTFSV
jgi:putative membrane protein